MKKRIGISVLVVLLVFCGFVMKLTGGTGNTDECERIVGESVHYTEKEIHQMMDLVEKTFRTEFSGCYLIELEYDEALSDLYAQNEADLYQADRAVIFTSVFDVGPSGGDGSLNPNSTYASWQWILTQTGVDPWVLQSWGY